MLSSILGLHARPSKTWKIILAILPFVIVLGIYFSASEARHRVNENDKLLPTFSQIAESTQRLAFEENKRTGKVLLWADTGASLKRLFIGLSIATFFALLVGVNLGAFPGLSTTFVPFVTGISMVPPLAILPILFIIFGIGETGKIILILIGTFPLMARDVYMAAKKIPQEQITKALTLGASQLAVVYKVILPQIMPSLLRSLRLSLGAAWLFLIAAEAIAATDGLGYRIFLVRRYMSMDIIIPYVVWITILGFIMDYGLKLTIQHGFAWYKED